eukprot:364892-Chlamydomonas_euryale.AAC.9
MKWLFFSRARYTLPNLPLPSGLPISKSDSVHDCFDAAAAGLPASASPTALVLAAPGAWFSASSLPLPASPAAGTLPAFEGCSAWVARVAT